MFDKDSTKKDYWGQVFKMFSVITGSLAAVLLLCWGAAIAITHLGMWAFVPFIIILIFVSSALVIAGEWRNR